MLAAYGDDGLERLKRDWRFWARPEQRQPSGLWTIWPVITGRGWGKTRTGAEFIIDRSETFATFGARHRVLLVGATVADYRDVMIEGETGLIECAERRGLSIKYEPSKRRVTMPDLGTTMTCFTAEKPDQLRGPQGHTGWADEPGKWKHYVDREGNSAWSNLMLALRLEGDLPAEWFDDLVDEDDEDDYVFEEAPPELQPRVCATTTPKPIPLIKEWVRRASEGDPAISLTTGSMMENVANLAPRFVQEILARYEGTRLGAQEISGILLDSVEGALWTPALIDRDRVHRVEDVPELKRVVAVDPSGSGHGHGDDCGIIVEGIESNPADQLRRHLYVLDDLSSGERPEVWARVVCDAYHRYGAEAVVCETNFGGALVVDVIHLTDPTVRVETVRATANRGKRPRAEPVALLYDQRRVHHVGYFAQLEAEQCTWVPDEDMDSPNAMDALVWGAHYLLPEISSPPASSTTAAEVRMPTGADAMIHGGGGTDSIFGWPTG